MRSVRWCVDAGGVGFAGHFPRTGIMPARGGVAGPSQALQGVPARVRHWAPRERHAAHAARAHGGKGHGKPKGSGRADRERVRLGGSAGVNRCGRGGPIARDGREHGRGAGASRPSDKHEHKHDGESCDIRPARPANPPRFDGREAPYGGRCAAPTGRGGGWVERRHGHGQIPKITCGIVAGAAPPTPHESRYGHPCPHHGRALAGG